MTGINDWLADAEKRCEAATEGPWKRDWYAGITWPKPSLMTIYTRYNHCLAEYLTEPDADFIAADRTDLPKALAALRAVLELTKERPYLVPFGDDEGDEDGVLVSDLLSALAEALGVGHG